MGWNGIKRIKRKIAAATLLLLCAAAAGFGALSARAAAAVGTPETADAAENSAQEALPAFFPLMDAGGVSARLYDVIDFETGARKVFFRLSNTRNDSVKVYLDHFCIGDSVCLENSGYKQLKAGETADYEPVCFTYTFLDTERDGVPPQDFHVTIKVTAGTKGNEEVLFNGTCTAEYPRSYVPQLVYETALSAKADKQVLRDDGSVRITLLCLGKFLGSDDSYPVQGVVVAENMSDATIPFYLQSCKINGYTIKVDGTTGGNLRPRGVIYSAFKCPKRLINSSKITEISDVSLQIMTSEEENTATIQSHSGGTWYPVVLSEYAAQGQENKEGEIIYEDDMVRIGLLGKDASYSKYSEKTQFQWDLSIVNKTDKDLEVQFSDFLINGEADPDDTLNFYVMLAEIGAGSMTNHRMLHFEEGVQELPDIAFRVRVQAVGGGALYNYQEDLVRIDAK